MKLLALIKVNLKGFMDDWKSVVVLIGLPMFIVAMIFASFGYDSTTLKVGTLENAESFNYTEFRDKADSFAELQKYSSRKDCVSDVKSFKIAGCIVIEEEGNQSFRISLHYDNTRQIVGKRVRRGVTQISDSMRLNYTERKASETLDKISQQEERIEIAQQQLTESNRNLGQQITFLDSKIGELEEARTSLRQDFGDMETRFEEVRQSLTQVENAAAEMRAETGRNLELAQANLSEMENLNQENQQKRLAAQEQLLSLNQSLAGFNNNISDIEKPRGQVDTGNQYLEKINSSITELRNSREALEDQKQSIEELNHSLENLREFNSNLAGKNISRLTSPVSSEASGLYTATDSEGVEKTDDKNLLQRQTIFSTVLVFIAIFVSLLVSQFISLKHINSSTVKRLRMIKGISFREYLALFIASGLIISVPMASVLIFGHYIFQLPIAENGLAVGIIVSLLCGWLINVGIAMAYLVKEKSITLLIGNLTLVFLSFFSGFVLPLEMMSPILGGFGSSQPGNIALKAFDSVVLYGQGLETIRPELLGITAWMVSTGAVALLIKRYRNL